MCFLDYSSFMVIAAVMLGGGLGAIPFGLILSKTFAGIDPRKIGSGNIGATNVLRTGHKSLAIATLLLDALKGGAAVLICHKLYASANGLEAYLAGFSAILGHMFTPLLRFKGGKGASTAAGALFALSWSVGLCTMFTWLLTLVTTRYSSLATLLGAIGMPFYAAYFGDAYLVIWCLIVTVIVILKHKGNIYRLIQGRELRIGAGKKQKS
ncbi:MAG: acyl-phosphate glycerol 3-phosphate acyltransferase [Caedibacter sp. 38-128]|nr:MAG: acyl-phosphate glycerol 3-phosphate acyltransferase [Caedibacter sp. 38-128]